MGARLANDVRWAMRQEVDCILVHEQRDEPEYGACEFGEFFVNVPEDIALTLFQSKMAIPLRSAPFLAISAACIAHALGIVPQTFTRVELQRQLAQRFNTGSRTSMGDSTAEEEESISGVMAGAGITSLSLPGNPRLWCRSVLCRLRDRADWDDGASSAQATEELSERAMNIEIGMPRSWVLLPYSPGGILRRGDTVAIPRRLRVGSAVTPRSRLNSLDGNTTQIGRSTSRRISTALLTNIPSRSSKKDPSLQMDHTRGSLNFSFPKPSSGIASSVTTPSSV